MLKLLWSRLRRGTATRPFPSTGADVPERFRGRPALDPSRCAPDCRSCAAAAPSRFLQIDSSGHPRLDLGTCLFSPDEAAACPHGAVTYTRETAMATSSREALVTASGEVERARALDRKARALFGRSLRLRSVVAGSCGGCEAELVALGNVVFDLGRFGIQFVASPRHADGIVITGAVNVNMRTALEKTWRAVPEPRLVIAVGACAIGGGPFAGSPETAGGVSESARERTESGGDEGFRVDLWVPGCPPHPLTLLDGLLGLLGQMEDRRPR